LDACIGWPHCPDSSFQVYSNGDDWKWDIQTAGRSSEQTGRQVDPGK
jgi:hypothetical protein